MEQAAKNAFEQIVTNSLMSNAGWQRLQQARTKITESVLRQQFNTERAIEVFQTAIERAIWDNLGSAGATTTRSIRGSGIVEAHAARLAAEFKSQAHLEDQRPVRRGFLAGLFGK